MHVERVSVSRSRRRQCCVKLQRDPQDGEPQGGLRFHGDQLPTAAPVVLDDSVDDYKANDEPNPRGDAFGEEIQSERVAIVRKAGPRADGHDDCGHEDHDPDRS